MASDILKPEKDGNPRAAQTRIKGKSAGGIGGQRAHDLRLGPQPDYVDAARSHLNRVLIAPPTGTQLRKICEERRALRSTTRAMKSNVAVGVVGILTFGHEAQSIFEKLTPDQQDAAYLETASAIATRLNTTLAGLVVHADESAPHAQYVLPAFDLSGHPISETAKRTALRDLQTITAEIMGRHAPGIERGRSKLDRLKAGATPAEVVNRSVAQLHDELPFEIAQLEAEIAAKKEQSASLDADIVARQGRLAELADKIEKNERLAAAAVEKAAANEAKADKALRNAALYEGRAEKARRERDAEERVLSNLQLDRRKEEERLERLKEQQAAILAENQRQTELGREIAEKNKRRLATEQQKVDALTIELGRLEAETTALETTVEQQQAFIADADRIADIAWDRANEAMDALSAAEAKRRVVDQEAAQIRDKALKDAQEAADAVQAAVEAKRKAVALETTQIREVALREAQAAADALLAAANEEAAAITKRSHQSAKADVRAITMAMLGEDGKAFVNLKDENRMLKKLLAHYETMFTLLRDTVKKLVPSNLRQQIVDSFSELWDKHPNNLDATKPSAPSATPKGPGPS